MLGQIYQEEVAENGGKRPHLGKSVVLNLASKLWLRARALERGRNGNAASHAQVHICLLTSASNALFCVYAYPLTNTVQHRLFLLD